MLPRLGKRNHARGFTLLELVIVIVILAILAGLAVPRFMRTATRSRGAEALQMMVEIRSSCERFFTRNSATGYATIAGDLANLDFDPANVGGTANFTYAADQQAADAYRITATYTGAGGGLIRLTKTAGNSPTIDGTGQFSGI